MGKTCISCRESGKGTLFHRFPRDPVTHAQWLYFINQESVNPENARMCSSHFTPDDYKQDSKRLKEYAVPSIIVPTKDRLKPGRNTDSENPDGGLEIEQPKIIETSEISIFCDICKKDYVFKSYDTKIFSREKILLTHIKVHHSGQFGKHKCQVCDMAFLSNAKLRQHKMKDHGILPHKYPCDYCDKSFISIKFAEIHQKEVHGILSNSYGCDICYETFLSAAILEEHRQTIHDIYADSEQHSCDLCFLIFPDTETLEEHKKLHTDVQMLACDVCGLSFQTVLELIAHKNSHEYENFTEVNEQKHSNGYGNYYPCQNCGKVFLLKAQLKQHTSTHIRDKPYACNLCGQPFYKVKTLIKHVRTHQDKKPYTCNICGRSFCEKGALRIHKRQQDCEEPKKNIVDHEKANAKEEVITEPTDADYDPSQFLETQIDTEMKTEQ